MQICTKYSRFNTHPNAFLDSKFVKESLAWSPASSVLRSSPGIRFRLQYNYYFFDFAPVPVRKYGPWRTWANHICQMSTWFTFPHIRTVQKNRVSKPRHAARLRQPSYDKFENIYGKKYFNCRPVFSEGVLCFELVVVENCLARYQKGTTWLRVLAHHMFQPLVWPKKKLFANRWFQLSKCW